MSTPLLEISKLTVKRGGRKILAGVDLTVARGDFVCVVGPNGAGKTTLLKCLNRLIDDAKGEVIVDGKLLQDYGQKELARLMSYVPQADERHLPFSVYEFVMMGRYPHLSPFSTVSEADERAVRRAMATTGCERFAERSLMSLSGGERQKVFVAASLAQGASILLLDEPTTFLDPRHQTEIYKTLQNLNEDSGITVVLVTHDINLGAVFGRSIAALRDGRVAFHGPSEDFMDASVLESLYGIPFSLMKTRAGHPIALQEGL